MDRTLLAATLTVSAVVSFAPCAVSAMPVLPLPVVSAIMLPANRLPEDFLDLDLADVSDIVDADHMASEAVVILLSEGMALLAG